MKKKEVTVLKLTPNIDEMEGALRATGISSTAVSCGSSLKMVIPNPEVPEKASRRL